MSRENIYLSIDRFKMRLEWVVNSEGGPIQHRPSVSFSRTHAADARGKCISGRNECRRYFRQWSNDHNIVSLDVGIIHSGREWPHCVAGKTPEIHSGRERKYSNASNKIFGRLSISTIVNYFNEIFHSSVCEQ